VLGADPTSSCSSDDHRTTNYKRPAAVPPSPVHEYPFPVISQGKSDGRFPTKLKLQSGKALVLWRRPPPPTTKYRRRCRNYHAGPRGTQTALDDMQHNCQTHREGIAEAKLLRYYPPGKKSDISLPPKPSREARNPTLVSISDAAYRPIPPAGC